MLHEWFGIEFSLDCLMWWTVCSKVGRSAQYFSVFILMVFRHLCVLLRLAVLFVLCLRAYLPMLMTLRYWPTQLMLCGACCQSVRRRLQNFLYLLLLQNQNVLSAHLDVCLRNWTLFVVRDVKFVVNGTLQRGLSAIADLLVRFGMLKEVGSGEGLSHFLPILMQNVCNSRIKTRKLSNIVTVGVHLRPLATPRLSSLLNLHCIASTHNVTLTWIRSSTMVTWSTSMLVTLLWRPVLLYSCLIWCLRACSSFNKIYSRQTRRIIKKRHRKDSDFARNLKLPNH